MKFKSQDIINVLDGEEVEGFLVVDEGDWTQDHKLQLRTTIFKYAGKFYEVYESRSGSYHTDWYYESDDWGEEIDCMEVVPVEKTVTTWVAA